MQEKDEQDMEVELGRHTKITLQKNGNNIKEKQNQLMGITDKSMKSIKYCSNKWGRGSLVLAMRLSTPTI